MINPTMIGKNIYLRPVEIGDIDRGWQKWINEESVIEFLDGVYPVTKDNLLKYYHENQPPRAVMFSICDKSDDTYIGNAKLGSINWINRTCSYGRIIGPEKYKGKGYGSEALILLVKYGFMKLGMNRICSGAIEGNIASLKSNEKVGFVQEGIQREAVWRNGKYNNVILLAITRNDFLKKYGSTEK
tara:strand:+ start:12559 stop:13116 length:558 start_codon:yes stop_codon:yes gene_type:complete